MKRTFINAFLALSVATSVHGQSGTKPIRYTWIATSCTTWNCAAAALVIADGEPNVLVLPTSITDHPWIILRRVEEGSVYVPEDEPFGCGIRKRDGGYVEIYWNGRLSYPAHPQRTGWPRPGAVASRMSWRETPRCTLRVSPYFRASM